MYIDQDDNVGSILIDSESSSAHVVEVASINTTGHSLYVHEATLTSGAAIEVNSNSSDTTARNLVRFTNDNTAAVGCTTLFLQQDSSGDAIIAQGGNIRVTKGGSAFQTSQHHAWVMGG